MKNEDWILQVNYLEGKGKRKHWEIYGVVGRKCYVTETEEEAKEYYIESATGFMEHATEEEKEIALREAEFDIAVDNRKVLRDCGFAWLPKEFKISIEAKRSYIDGEKTLAEAVDWYFAEMAKAKDA